jgi:hypothetical protein
MLLPLLGGEGANRLGTLVPIFPTVQALVMLVTTF